MEVLMRLSQDELERHRYAERIRAQRDAASAAADLRDARQVGIEIGKRIGRVQLLQQLLGLPEMSITELGRLPDEDLEQMEETLKQQLSAPKPGTGNVSLTDPATPPTEPPSRSE
jgi:hypothetical protein